MREKKEGTTTYISAMPKLWQIVLGREKGAGAYTHTDTYTHEGKHDKINFAVTVIPVAVRQRVKYEQKSRHRYRVYANSLGGIDERRDVTANIRFPHLSYCRVRIHTYISYIYIYTHTHAHMAQLPSRSHCLHASPLLVLSEIPAASVFPIHRIRHTLWYRFPSSVVMIDPLSFSRRRLFLSLVMSSTLFSLSFYLSFVSDFNQIRSR